MRIVSILFFLTFSIYFNAQSYRLNSTWNGAESCSGGAYYSEFFHRTTVYDINGNIIGQLNSPTDQIRTEFSQLFTNRPYRVVHSFDCQILEGPNSGFVQTNEVIIPTSGNCISDTVGNLSIQLFVPTTLLEQPITNIFCIDQLIPLSATNDCTGANYDWYYSFISNGTYIPLNLTSAGSNFIQANLTNIVPSNYSGNLFIRARAVNDFTNIISFSIIGCSPNLQNTSKTDETCFGANDGSATLTFDSDIATDSDMRYYFYKNTSNAATPQAAFQGTTDSPIPPQSFAEVRLGSLVDNNNGTYSGSSMEGDIISGDGKLEEGEYYVLYQEVDYSTTPVTVKSGELAPDFFTINSPTQVVTTGLFTAATCGNPAEIALSASGGNAPSGYTYQYSVNNNTNWQAATNPLEITPTANQQTIYVRAVIVGNTDCYGTEIPYVLAQSTPQLSILGNPTFVPPTTDISTNGSIRVEIQNGTPNYTYVLTNVNSNQIVETKVSPLKTIDFLNIAISTYRITVTDAEGCPQTSGDIIVTKEPIPTPIANTPTQITCFNSADGEVSAQINGIIGSYKYQWIVNGTASAIEADSSPTQTLFNINVGGSYVLRVASGRLSDAGFFDADNYNEIPIPLNNPSQVVINNADPNKTSCNGGTDGSIILDLSGGTSYEYALGNSPTNWSALTGNTISNLNPGTYTVTVRNQNGCESQPFTSIFVDEPSILQVAEVPNSRLNVSTNGGLDGAIFIAIIGGTPGINPEPEYTYLWSGTLISDGSSYTNNTKDVSGLYAGTYSVEVTDDKECTTTLSGILIDQPGPLGITALNPTPVACKGSATGSITAVVTGLEPFNYAWTKDGDATFTAPNLATITDLAFGTYTLTLTDATGDPAVTSSVLITEPTNALSATATPIPASCFNGTDGQINITALGGTAPYQYDFNTGLGLQNSPSLPNLTTGTYNVTVLDANSCEFTIANLFVDQATEINITTDLIVNVTEAGQSDGAIYTSIAGGSWSFTYQWTGPNGFNEATKDITNLGEGIYTLNVTDANNCTASQVFNITEPGELVVDVQQTLFLACNGDTTAEIIASVEGGVPNYSYEWSQIINGSTTTLNEDANILANLPAGSYIVVVTDANGVAKTSTTIVITEPDVLAATLVNKVDVLCNGEATGSIVVAIAGGTAPYKFYWDGNETTQNISDLSAGDYFFEVIDANGCFDQLEVTIKAPLNPLAIAFEIVTDASAYQATDGSITLDISGGAPNYTLVWTRLSDNTFISYQTAISNLAADTYQINITDTNGCSLTEVYEVSQPDIIEETITAPICAGGDDGSISLIVNKGNGTFTYSWNTGDTTSSITNLNAGEYTVVISGFDQPISRTYTVEDPLPIIVNLGEDRVLCLDQTLELDATVENPTATYLWAANNGFSSTEPAVVLVEQGNYTLTISTDTGCSVTGDIAITVSDEEISAEVAASSQVYVGESLILVDISYPLPESMEWIIPENATIINNTNDEAEIVFDSPGEYEIGIITQRGPCTAIQTKKVLVVANDPTVKEEDTENGKKIIEEFVIYPNPTAGIFNASVQMNEIGNISIKIFSFANNSQIAVAKERGKSSYTIPFDISNMPAGVYAVLLETPFGATLRKLIVK